MGKAKKIKREKVKTRKSKKEKDFSLIIFTVGLKFREPLGMRLKIEF